MKNKRVLVICNHYPDRSPGQRFRFEQYLSYLRENGFDVDVSFLLNAVDDKLFYSKGNYFAKFKILTKSFFKRLADTRKANQYDIVFLFREAIFTGTTFFEKRFASKSKMIFDFDDSIWMSNVSEANKRLAFLKNADKTSDIIGMSHLIFAGNQYLADYALKFNKNVVIVPTTIDTVEYTRMETPKTNQVCIGWSGSITTIQHFEFAIPALMEIKKKYGDRVNIKVIGDGNYKNEELGIKGLPWVKSTEIQDLSSIEIGIMPLPDDEWAKGKCGLKGLQYMSLSIPTIMSPVGVNSEIIQDGENGYLASTTAEWVEKISLLVESAELRKKLGDAGRKTVVDKYSVEANKNKYLEYMTALAK